MQERKRFYEIARADSRPEVSSAVSGPASGPAGCAVQHVGRELLHVLPFPIRSCSSNKATWQSRKHFWLPLNAKPLRLAHVVRRLSKPPCRKKPCRKELLSASQTQRSKFMLVHEAEETSDAQLDKRIYAALNADAERIAASMRRLGARPRCPSQPGWPGRILTTTCKCPLCAVARRPGLCKKCHCPWKLSQLHGSGSSAHRRLYA